MHLARPKTLTEAVSLATTCEAFEAPSPSERAQKPRAEFVGKIQTEQKGAKGTKRNPGEESLPRTEPPQPTLEERLRALERKAQPPAAPSWGNGAGRGG